MTRSALSGSMTKTLRWGMSLLLIALVAALLAVGAGGCGSKPAGDKAETPAAKQQKYYCPMHPTYTSDKLGDCPICNMRLVPIPEEESGADGASMHEDHGEASSTTEEAESSPMDHAAHGAAPARSSMTPSAEGAGGSAPGYVRVRISPEKQQLIGVRLARAESGDMSKTIRAVGKVEYDETRLHHFHTKVDGWIGKLYVAYTGQAVRAGSPLFTLYSPEMVATQQEYLLARTAAASAPPGSPLHDLVSSVEKRLLLWDLHGPQLEEIAQAGAPKTYVDIASHASGIVVEKQALEGMRVMPGEDLYSIADLSRVWVTAAIYEYELSDVKVGQEASITLSYGTADTLTGKITYIYPYLDEKTRSAQVRFEFPNQKLLLKPGMFANVELQIPMKGQVTIPVDAVFDTGNRQLVFVAKGGGLFEPRDVRLGSRFDARVAVTQGIAAGEEVVVGAQFLVDSESQLRAALAGMGSAGEHRH